uniref:Uncharacterized protein n=1 Tax=Tanacetum cinerariifolium TaxID=118510 RepID=A0A6L2MJM4_TANCI|nr:hypothetical protein [Tanacetum cinerariifolium]
MALHRQMGLSFQAAIVTGKKIGRILVLSKEQITLWGKPSRANQGRRRKREVKVAATTETKEQYIDIYDGTRAKALAEKEKQDLLVVSCLHRIRENLTLISRWSNGKQRTLRFASIWGVRSVTFSPDGKYVLSSTLGGRYVDV